MPGPKSTKGRRRPREEDFEPIFEAIADGMSLRQICSQRGVDAGAAHKAITSDPVLKQQYIWARERAGDDVAYEVAQIVEKMLAGELKPDQARVAIDAHKWRAGQMAGKYWGKNNVNIGGEDGGPIKIEEARASLADKLASIALRK